MEKKTRKRRSYLERALATFQQAQKYLDVLSKAPNGRDFSGEMNAAMGYCGRLMEAGFDPFPKKARSLKATFQVGDAVQLTQRALLRQEYAGLTEVERTSMRIHGFEEVSKLYVVETDERTVNIRPRHLELRTV